MLPGISRQVLSVTMEPKYQCQQCKGVLRKPFQAQCGHRFCVFCLKQLTRYPRLSLSHALHPLLLDWFAQTHPVSLIPHLLLLLLFLYCHPTLLSSCTWAAIYCLYGWRCPHHVLCPWWVLQPWGNAVILVSLECQHSWKLYVSKTIRRSKLGLNKLGRMSNLFIFLISIQTVI